MEQPPMWWVFGQVKESCPSAGRVIPPIKIESTFEVGGYIHIVGITLSSILCSIVSQPAKL